MVFFSIIVFFYYIVSTHEYTDLVDTSHYNLAIAIAIFANRRDRRIKSPSVSLAGLRLETCTNKRYHMVS